MCLSSCNSLDEGCAQQVTEEAAAGRESALDAAGGQAATVLARREHSQVLRIELPPVADALGCAVVEQ